MYLYNCFFVEAPRVLGNTWHHICLKCSSVKVLIEKLLLHSVSPFFQCPIAPTLLSSYFHGHSRHSPLRRNLGKQVSTSNGLKTWIRETRKIQTFRLKVPLWVGEEKVLFRMFSPIFAYCLSLLGQWLNFQLFGITYLVGKISRSKFYFKVHWLSELYIWMILLSSQLQAQTSLQRCLPFASWSAPGGPWGVSFEKVTWPWIKLIGGFKYVLFSSRTLGKIPIFTHIFSDGLEAPTSKCLIKYLRMSPN